MPLLAVLLLAVLLLAAIQFKETPKKIVQKIQATTGHYQFYR